MVYAFIVQGLTSRAGNEKIEILYSEVFGAGLNINVPADDQRQLRQDQIQLISQRVNSELVFRMASHIAIENQPQTIERLLPTVEAGVFRLPKGKPLPLERHVIWQAMGDVAFSMVLSPDENKALAENVLSLIVRFFLQIFRSVDGFKEMKTSPEKVATVLHVYLPSGQLIFMNHRVIKQMEKNVNQILNERK